MSLSFAFIKLANAILPPIVHPFNLQNDGIKTYAQWQYEKGGDTVKFFSESFPPEVMFKDKRVLDMGCGAAGKSLYYASMGAAHVTGVDIVEHYKAEAEQLAEQLGLSDRFTFCLGSAYELPYPDGSFDTIIMNDFMEHTGDPEATLREAMRLLAPGGRCYINFPPYGHPYGAHMSDLINMPWVHCFVSEHNLCVAYKELAQKVPDGDQRIEFRIKQKDNGKYEIAYINKMSLKRFNKLIESFGITPEYYKEVPLRSYFKPLAKFPLTKELFVKMAVCVIKK
ncbi:MAG: methyltransferase domain-containing protein [Firmicutes bacterium]|nr:methyltransferase domain-containing protein [Bacillota bacterium]